MIMALKTAHNFFLNNIYISYLDDIIKNEDAYLPGKFWQININIYFYRYNLYQKSKISQLKPIIFQL